MMSALRGSAARSVAAAAGRIPSAAYQGAAPVLLHYTRGLSTANAEVVAESRFAAVDHSEAYEQAMKGLHGQQLALASIEGEGKDDAPFDPFIEEELEEARFLRESEFGIKEAEYVDLEEDEDDEDDEDGLSSIYNNDGSLRRKKSERATLRAGSPAGGLVAVIELAGSQHKVTTDDLLIVNRLRPVDTFNVGSIHTLTDVMLVGSSHLTLVGMPFVSGAEVDVMVEEVTKDAKVIVFKHRRRKNYRKKNGFRRDVTMLRVLDIRPPESYEDHKHVERLEPEL